MKIFITGGTGYIGSHLVKALVARGYIVHALCRSENKAKQISGEGVEIFFGDLDKESKILEAMKGCDIVFHVAAIAKVWEKDSGRFYKINVEGTKNVLDAALECGVKRVIFTSTGGVYGASINGPLSESSVRQKDFFNEYEGSKCLAESWVKDYVIQGLDVVIVSPTRVYGPYLFGKPESATRMIHDFVKGSWRWIPGPAEKLGNYVYIDDVIEGHILAMEKGEKGRTYILGGANHSYTDFFSILKSVSGIKRKLFPLPISLIYLIAYISLKLAEWFNIEPALTPKWVAKAKYNWEVDTSRAVLELGLKPTSLESGLRKTVEWIRS